MNVQTGFCPDTIAFFRWLRDNCAAADRITIDECRAAYWAAFGPRPSPSDPEARYIEWIADFASRFTWRRMTGGTGQRLPAFSAARIDEMLAEAPQ
jgi:hypothetical protein